MRILPTPSKLYIITMIDNGNGDHGKGDQSNGNKSKTKTKDSSPFLSSQKLSRVRLKQKGKVTIRRNNVVVIMDA